MYAIAIIRYRKPLEEVQKHIDAHRAYCQGLKQEGLLIASGPMVPRNGGACCCAFPITKRRRRWTAFATTIRTPGSDVAQYEMWPWAPASARRTWTACNHSRLRAKSDSDKAARD